MYALRERLGWIWLAVIITAAGLTPSTRREETVWSSSQREVFMTLNQEIQASRLIAGLTWGGNGAWTSWPPRGHGMLIFGYWQPTHMRAVVTIWRYWIPGGNR